MGTCSNIVKLEKPHIQHFSLKESNNENYKSIEILDSVDDPCNFKLLISNIRGILFSKVKYLVKISLESE